MTDIFDYYLRLYEQRQKKYVPLNSTDGTSKQINKFDNL